MTTDNSIEYNFYDFSCLGFTISEYVLSLHNKDYKSVASIKKEIIDTIIILKEKHKTNYQYLLNVITVDKFLIYYTGIYEKHIKELIGQTR